MLHCTIVNKISNYIPTSFFPMRKVLAQISLLSTLPLRSAAAAVRERWVPAGHFWSHLYLIIYDSYAAEFFTVS